MWWRIALASEEHRYGLHSSFSLKAWTKSSTLSISQLEIFLMARYILILFYSPNSFSKVCVKSQSRSSSDFVSRVVNMKKPKPLPSLSIYPRDGRVEAFGVLGIPSIEWFHQIVERILEYSFLVGLLIKDFFTFSLLVYTGIK